LADTKVKDLTEKAIGAATDQVYLNDVVGGNLDKRMPLSGIRVTESQITDLQTYLTDITGEALSTISDVTITGIASGELLKWNGSAWINNTLAEAGISATGHSHTESDITDLGSYITASSSDTLTNKTIDANGTGNSITNIDLTADITNTLPIANGGTNLTTYTTGDILYSSATNVLSALAKGTANQVLTMDGTGTNIVWAASAAGFADPMTTRGDIIIRNASNVTDRLAVGTNGQVLTSDGTDISWGAAGAGSQTPWTQDIDADGFNLVDGGIIKLREQATADADTAGAGQIWIKTATPNEIWFTDDAGSDFQVAHREDTLGVFAATSSNDLAAVISDETGTGALVFATSPVLVTPALGVPSSGTLTNCTGLPFTGLANGTDGELITWDAAGAITTVAVGTSGQVLTSNGAGAEPTFQAAGIGTWTDSSSNTGTNKTLDDSTNTIHANAVHLECRNTSGGTLAQGDAVYFSGYDVGTTLPLITLADADNASAMPAAGIVEDAAGIGNNANGLVLVRGRLSGFDTTFGAEDAAVYISTSGTTGNTLTTTRPTGTTSAVQKVGVILRSHATLGEMEISGASRSNDVPNLEDAKLWVGNGSNVATAVAMSGDATMSNTGAVTLSATKDPVGVHDIWVGAAGMWPITTAGCSDLTKRELATNDVNIQTLLFDTTTEEHAQFSISLPRNWNNGTVTATFHWTNAAGLTTETVDWAISAVAFADNDALDTAFGSEVTTTDTWLAQDDLHISAESTAITIAGSPADGELVQFQIARKTATDDLTGDAELIGIVLHITTDAATAA